MAMSVNKVILVGNLGQDPEIRNTSSGQRLASFSVATSDSWKDKNGERQDRTEWHRIVVFNTNLIEVAEKYLKKGSKVYVEGTIQSREYVDKAGNERSSTEIVLGAYRGELVSLDSRSSGMGGGAAAPAFGGGNSSGWDAPATTKTAEVFDDEIPF